MRLATKGPALMRFRFGENRSNACAETWRHRVEKGKLEVLNELPEKIIGCAIGVHRNLGPGLLESIYEKALCFELKLNKISFENQVSIPIRYKEQYLGEHRLDLHIENKLIVELKATNKITSIFKAQLLSYLRLTNISLGLLINFNVPVLKNGIKRIIL